MVENIQKIAERRVAAPHPVDERLRVVLRQHATGAGQPHERHLHFGQRPVGRAAGIRPRGLGEFDRGDFASREGVRRQRGEPHRLAAGRTVLADGHQTGVCTALDPLAADVFQQSDCLEKLELVRFLLQALD